MNELINNKHIRRKNIILLLIYVPVFFIVWSIYTLNFSSSVHELNSVPLIILKNTFKYLVWTIPVFVLLKYYYKDNPIIYLKLKRPSLKTIGIGFAIGLLFVVYHILLNFLLKGHFDFNFDYYTWIHIILLIGVTEEVVFRGFILQKLQEVTKFWIANLVSSILFLLIHFPRYYSEGTFKGDLFNLFGSIIFVFCFGLIQSYVLKKTKSLWVCMIIHSLNNFITIGRVM